MKELSSFYRISSGVNLMILGVSSWSSVFSANHYFKNSVLTEPYHMIDYYDSVLGKAIG